MNANAPGRTRQQQHLRTAHADITSIRTAEESVRNLYGNLCHAIPPMVLADGLCQTLAFIESKAKPDNAYSLIRQSIANLYGVDDKKLLSTVAKDSVQEYIWKTRVLLQAWVYYKRFAVSILNVQAGANDDAQIEAVDEVAE